MYIDVEMISLAIESLKATGLKYLQIDLGQASFFQSLMKEVELPNQVQREIQQKLEQKMNLNLKRY
nr:ATP phosphoribosyltransferase regulatory subunit [Piscibacillus salipiscarius]